MNVFVLLNTKEDILKKVCNQAVPQTCSVSTHMLQNIFLCVQQNKHWLSENQATGHPGGDLPLVTPYKLRFWLPRPWTSRVSKGPCLPALRNHDSGFRGCTLQTPLYPPQGTRCSGRGGRISLNPSARLNRFHPRPPFLRGTPLPIHQPNQFWVNCPFKVLGQIKALWFKGRVGDFGEASNSKLALKA